MIGGRKIAVNTLLLVAASVLNLAISLFTTTIIARSIGPELYGRYTFGLNFVLIFSVFANFGLESLFIREAARDRTNLALIGDIFGLKIVLAFATSLLTVGASFALRYPPQTRTVVAVLALGLFFQILGESLLSVHRAMERMQIPALASTLFRLIGAGIIAFSVFGGIGFYGIVAAYTIANGAIFLWALAITRRHLPRWVLAGFPGRAAVLIRGGMPFFQSAVLTMVYAKINILILSKFSTEGEMGYYLSGLNLVENLYFVPTAFVTSIFPAFSRVCGVSPDALRAAYRKITKYLLVLAVATACGTLLVAEPVISLIYGRAFLPAVPVLRILIFLWVFTFFSQTQSTLLFSIGQERVQVRIMAAACVINLLSNLVLISRFGYLGAAAASVLTEAAVVVLVSTVLWRHGYRFYPDGAVLRLVLAAAAMALVVRSLLAYNLGAAIAAGAAVYLGGLLLFRVVNAEDLALLRSAVSRKPNPSA